MGSRVAYLEKKQASLDTWSEEAREQFVRFSEMADTVQGVVGSYKEMRALSQPHGDRLAGLESEILSLATASSQISDLDLRVEELREFVSNTMPDIGKL